VTTPEHIGSAIQTARKSHKLSTTALCAMTGFSPRTLRELERGLGNPRLSTLLVVCDVLELSVQLTPLAIEDLVLSDPKTQPTQLSEIIRHTHLRGLTLSSGRGANKK